MGKIYKLNEIKIKTEADALEFIDMVAYKLTDVKVLLKKSSLERQSLLNRLGQAQSDAVSHNNYSNDDVQTSVLQRATGQTSPDAAKNESDGRIAQLRAAQQPPAPVDPGEIGQLELDEDAIEQPSSEDLKPIGERVSGKAESLKVVERRQQKSNDLRKK